MFTKNQQHNDYSKQPKSSNEVDIVTSVNNIKIKNNDSKIIKRNICIFSFTIEKNVNINLYNLFENNEFDEEMNMYTQAVPLFIQNPYFENHCRKNTSMVIWMQIVFIVVHLIFQKRVIEKDLSKIAAILVK